MVPGWSQTAEQYKYQLEGFSGKNHCVAIDMRGHGDSENVEYGYKMQRLAKDLYEFLSGLDLRDVILMGHSLGCSVLWAYWELYGSERIEKLILIDQPAFMTINPEWDESEIEETGALFTTDELIETYNSLTGPEEEEFSVGMIHDMFARKFPEEEDKWIIDCSMKLPRHLAAKLIYNHAFQDWRDVIKRIDVPTLIVGAKGSQVNWKSQEWIHRQIPGSTLIIFEEEHNVKHFMFLENPEKFNRVVSEFI